MSSFELTRLSGRLLRCAWLATVVAALGGAPAMVHAQPDPDHGQTEERARALIESIPQIGYEGYLEAVIYGIENVSQTQQSVMPAFGEVEDVVNYGTTSTLVSRPAPTG